MILNQCLLPGLIFVEQKTYEVWASETLSYGTLLLFVNLLGMLRMKKENLWVKWVNNVYIQVSNWGFYEALNTTS